MFCNKRIAHPKALSIYKRRIRSDLKKEEDRINALIEMVWKKRGIYPSLSFVLNNFVQNIKTSEDIIKTLLPLLNNKYDLIQFFKDILQRNIPGELDIFEDELLDMSDNRIFKKNHLSFAKLSLFVLTENQIEKIIADKELLKEIESNPYSLCEDYISEEDDLDIPDMQDEPIDVFKIDMGMIPDKKYLGRLRNLQNLVEDSPERVRSVIINYLNYIGKSGHCYDSVNSILKDLYEHPLIYKNEIRLDDEALLELEDDYRNHFIQKLFINETNDNKYLYLQVVKR